MKYGIHTIDGAVICDPIEFNAERFRDIVTRCSGIAGNVPVAPSGYAYYCGNLVLAPERVSEDPKPSSFAYLYEKHVAPWKAVDGVLERVISWVEITDVDRKAELIAAEKTKAKLLIDQAAGQARQSFVSEGYLVEEEYRLALVQAKEWIAAGKAGDAPDCIAVWAAASGLSESDAADNIVQTGEAWDHALAAIRSARLIGKANIDALPDDSDIQESLNIVLDNLRSISA